MAEEKKDPLAQVKNFWNKLTVSQRLFLGISAVISVVIVLLVVNIANSLTYGVLFSNLSAGDSGTIIEKLKEQKIPYKISAGGSIIEVPEGQVPELRIEMAKQGLPAGGGVGYEIFDKNSLSTTDFVQNINYLRAKEGELARSISSLNEVSSAKVHITLPKRSVFIEKQEPAKASIVLRLKPGALVNYENGLIPAIIHLTAQSVEGLNPDNIAVVDINGRLLSMPTNGNKNELGDVSNTQLSYQKKRESALEKKIKSQLEPIVGGGKVRADVSLALDFNKVETKEEAVDPNETVKISEQKETMKSTGSKPGGVPGVNANVAQAGNINAAGGTAAKSESKKTTTNFEVTKKVTHQVKSIGEISKISVAVVVDNAAEVVVEEGELKKTYKPRTQQEIDAITRIVKAAVGFNEERGDIVEVANIPFDKSGETEDMFYYEQQKSTDFRNMLIKYGSYAIGLILIFFMILKPIFNKMYSVVKTASEADEASALLKGEGGSAIENAQQAALEDARDEEEIERELRSKYKLSKEDKKMEIIKDKIREFAEENPDGTASLIRTYLVEE